MPASSPGPAQGSLLGKEAPLPFHTTASRCAVPEWDSVMSPTSLASGSPALRKQCLLQVPFPRSHQRARTLPVAELRGPTEAPNGVGNLLQARRSSQARRRRGGRGGRIGYAPSSPTGALAPSTAVLATSACAVSTTTASGSITVWAKGTTGESGPRAQGGLGMRGSECESRDLETALRAGWGRECLEKLGAGVHSPCAALRLMLLMAASWDS